MTRCILYLTLALTLTLTQERKNREAFVVLLKEHVGSGKVTARTKWSSQYLLVVKHEDAYHAMCSNTAGSTPRELFDDQVESLVEALDKDKGVVKVRFEHRWKHTVLCPHASPHDRRWLS